MKSYLKLMDTKRLYPNQVASCLGTPVALKDEIHIVGKLDALPIGHS